MLSLIHIYDCYNAGPQSMAASLRVLGASGGKKTAVIGDMAELGELTELSLIHI